MPILMLAATINGYDGSLLNGLQTIDAWQECTCRTSYHTLIRYIVLTHTGIDFDNPTGSTLGLYTAIMNIGAFCALFFGKCVSHQE